MNPTHPSTLLVLAALVACVPPTDDLNPAGAAGYRTDPSPATRGEPFVTSDGWTIRIDQLALQVSASASPTSYDEDVFGAGSELYRFNAKDVVDVYVPGLSTASGWFVSLRLRGTFGFDIDNTTITSYGIDERLDARFVPTPNAAATGRRRFLEGPALVLVARAVRGEATKTLDVALRALRGFGNAPQFGPSFTVTKDALTTAHLGVAGENLFFVDGGRSFEPFAAADLDGNGVVTAEELAATPRDCPQCVVSSSGPPPTATTLADVLGANARSAVLQP